MEETLGKRIAAGRKRLGITQDRLAEQLGVTAQAVSKWENDQSCPDISMLPRLAEIFGTSTDALLGFTANKTEPISVIDPVTDDPEPEADHAWELSWDAGRKGYIGLAVWIILTAGCLFASNYLQVDVTLWGLLWTNGLLVFGIWGLHPGFSFFRLGCTLFGTYFLLEKFHLIPFYLGRDLLLPTFLLLFGLSLLVDALRKPKKHHFHIHRNTDHSNKSTCNCSTGEDSFDCSVSFCESYQPVQLPQLRRGSAAVSFGDLTVDLLECAQIAPDCKIKAQCSFGNMTLIIPEEYQVEVNSNNFFSSIAVDGDHISEPTSVIRVDANVSFGQISIKYA